MPGGADGLAEDTREVAPARQQFGHRLAGLEADECQRLGRLAICVPLRVRRRPGRIRHGRPEEGRYARGSRRSRRYEQQRRHKRRQMEC